MGRRSSSKRCLLCLAYCEGDDGPTATDHDHPSKFQIAGAMNFDPLQRQLENVFILRQVLNIPKCWCEEILKEGIGAGDGGDCLREDNNPADWFNVCDHCMETGIAEAWKVYQQIMVLQLKMAGIKDKIWERMRRETLKPVNRGLLLGWKKRRRKGISVEGKIREYLFSDSMTNKELMEEKEEVLLKVDPSSYLDDDDADWNVEPEVVSLDGESPAEEEINNWEDDFLNLPLCLFKDNRKRGRPLKSESEDIQLRKRLKSKLKKLGKGLPGSQKSTKLTKYKWHRCKVPNCDAIYSNEDDFKGHLLCHEERKEKIQLSEEGSEEEEKGPLDCPHCAFPGRDLEELEQHIEDRHLKKGSKFYPYFCPFCEFETPEEKNGGYPSLREHVDQSHKKEGCSEEELTSELPMICSMCPKKCANLRAFLTHHRKSHPERYGIQVENLECDHDQCGLKFSTQEDLKSHIRNTHKRCSKFVCDECGMGFKFLSRMERHKIAHYNNLRKEYICHICGVEYAYKSILDSHYRQFHPRGDGGGGGGGGGEGSNTLSGGEGGGEEFKCKYCELTSPFRVVILRHLRQHKEEMGHRCEHCGKCYVNIQGLKRHLRINHPATKEEVPCPHCLKCFISVEYMRDHMNKFCRMKKLVNESIAKTTTQEVVAASSSSLSSSEGHSNLNERGVISTVIEENPISYQDHQEEVDNHQFIELRESESLGVKMDLG